MPSSKVVNSRVYFWLCLLSSMRVANSHTPWTERPRAPRPSPPQPARPGLAHTHLARRQTLTGSVLSGRTGPPAMARRCSVRCPCASNRRGSDPNPSMNKVAPGRRFRAVAAMQERWWHEEHEQGAQGTHCGSVVLAGQVEVSQVRDHGADRAAAWRATGGASPGWPRCRPPLSHPRPGESPVGWCPPRAPARHRPGPRRPGRRRPPRGEPGAVDPVIHLRMPVAVAAGSRLNCVIAHLLKHQIWCGEVASPGRNCTAPGGIGANRACSRGLCGG